MSADHTPAQGLVFEQLGWTADHAMAFAPHTAVGYIPGRVVSGSAGGLAVTEAGLTEVIVQRRFAREVASPTELPTVGDWLALEALSESPRQAALRAVLPRTSAFVRQRLSDGQPQILAANVDVAFLVSGLDNDLNLRRIERYLVLALDGGVTPVVVLNKVDVALDLDRAVAEVHSVAAGTRVVVTSAVDGTGLDELRNYLEPGHSACLLGSSGAGKSTITNALLGEDRQIVKALREDDSKGRHTTTHRELFVMPGGGLLIDTPGLRTVGVMGEAESVGATFDEVEALAQRCKFSDCGHDSEPGCAIRQALEAGTLSADRLASHDKLEAERHSAQLRADERTRREADRQLGKFYKRHLKGSKQMKRGGH
jgi:ribosome biogenesis GTPase